MSIDYKKKYLKYKHKYLYLKGGDGHDDLRKEFIEVLCNIESKDKMDKFLLNFKEQITTPEKYNIFIDNLEVSDCGKNNRSVELLILDLKTIVQVNLSNIDPLESIKTVVTQLKNYNNDQYISSSLINEIELKKIIENIDTLINIYTSNNSNINITHIREMIKPPSSFLIRYLSYGHIIHKYKIFEILLGEIFNYLKEFISIDLFIKDDNLHGGAPKSFSLPLKWIVQNSSINERLKQILKFVVFPLDISIALSAATVIAASFVATIGTVGIIRFNDVMDGISPFFFHSIEKN